MVASGEYFPVKVIVEDKEAFKDGTPYVVGRQGGQGGRGRAWPAGGLQGAATSAGICTAGDERLCFAPAHCVLGWFDSVSQSLICVLEIGLCGVGCFPAWRCGVPQFGDVVCPSLVSHGATIPLMQAMSRTAFFHRELPSSRATPTTAYPRRCTTSESWHPARYAPSGAAAVGWGHGMV
jgi:hypothetical protein